MTIISDLSFDLVDEILCRVLLTSLGAVRSTCKRWNALCKDHKFIEKHCCALVNMKFSDCDQTMRVSLHNIKDLPSIKEIGEIRCPLNNIWKVFLCGGILLCVDKYDRMVLWNPFLAQTRCVKDCYYHHTCDYALGYDNNNNLKVLRIFYNYDESLEISKIDIYDLKSDSWRDLDTKSFRAWNRGVSLKGNTYFVERKIEVECVLCFDFTTERLGPPMHLPFNAATDTEDDVYISCIRDEQLALFFQRCRVTYEIEIWITTKIEPNAASWTKLFKVDMKPLCGSGFRPEFYVRIFFIDMDKKLAVVYGICYERGYPDFSSSYMVGENGYYKKLENGFYKELNRGDVVFSYIPSLVPII